MVWQQQQDKRVTRGSNGGAVDKDINLSNVVVANYELGGGVAKWASLNIQIVKAVLVEATEEVATEEVAIAKVVVTATVLQNNK